MTTVNIDYSTNLRIVSRDVDKADAQAGTGDVLEVGAARTVGQQNASGIYVSCYQYPISFDLSSYSTLILTAVALALTVGTDYSTTDFDVEAVLFDWASSVDAGDFRSKTWLAANTSLRYAHLHTSGLPGTTAFTNEAAFFTAMELPEDRPSTLRLMLTSSRQRTGDICAPGSTEYITLTKATLTLTHSGAHAMTLSVTRDLSALGQADNMSFVAEANRRATCRMRAEKSALEVGRIRVYDFARTYKSVLIGQAQISDVLDGPNRLSCTFPYYYTLSDGSAQTRASMVTGGWYLEYDGQWYRIWDYDRDKDKNSISVDAASAETDLDAFLTNYGQIPFSVESYTPTELMTAVFGGLPECDWYNGRLRELDDAGDLLGWTLTNFDFVAEAGENILYCQAASGEAQSEGIRHTSGAQIKPVVDLKVADGFVGKIELVLLWESAIGASTAYSERLTITPTVYDDWFTFTAPSWIPVKNERCYLSLVISENDDLYEVDFRRVRFVQNEASTGWTYVGSMDTRATSVAYNDPLWLRYGGWALDAVNAVIQTSTVDDTLGRSFTGDLVTVIFAAGGAGATCDVLVDGELRVSDLDVSVADSYAVTGLDRYRAHLLEIVCTGGTVKVSGLTISPENRIAVTWNRLGVYQALKALRDIVGGEYEFDTRDRTVYHDSSRGINVTTGNLLWLREGQNLGSFTVATDESQVGNRGYGGGYGDGAFQIGVVVDATETDDSGNTSQDLYGVQRFAYTNKDAQDVATLALDTYTETNKRAFPKVTYRATVSDADAAYLEPGDTCRVTHTLLGGTKTLRVLEVTRRSDGNAATVLWGDRITSDDPSSQYASLQRRVDQLLRKY